MGKNSGEGTLLKVSFDVSRVRWGVSLAWGQVKRLAKEFSIYCGWKETMYDAWHITCGEAKRQDD